MYRVIRRNSAARHPNLVALELSNFKCGHDAPVYTVVEEIVECSGTPYFSFKDIDENKPAGAIRLRVETIAYFCSVIANDLSTDAGSMRRSKLNLRRLRSNFVR